jgi:hypothetical protein
MTMSTLIDHVAVPHSDNQIYDFDLRNYSGSNRMAERHGSYFIYEETPRGLIFQRDVHNVVE